MPPSSYYDWSSNSAYGAGSASANTCVLSPSAQAFSTVLTAVVGSIINGLANGYFVAFFTGWIAWFAGLRVIASGLYELFLAFTGATPTPKPVPKSMKLKHNRLEQNVGPLGWIGWLWSAMYTPISQTIWLVVHYDSQDSGIKLARAFAIGVSALGLAFDVKHRYADRFGGFAFKIWHALMCLLLGAECVVLLVKGAIDLPVPVGFIAGYCVFSVIWAGASWWLMPSLDGVRRAGKFNKVTEPLVGALMGAFAGLFVATPAFVLLQNALFNANVAKTRGGFESGLSLGQYLSCEGVSISQKWAAIIP